MSKFNRVELVNNAEKIVETQNSSRWSAYRYDIYTTIVTQIATSFIGEEKFYGDNTLAINESALSLACSNDESAGFIAKCAVYARKELHLRSVSHLLVATLAHSSSGKQYVKTVVPRVVERADDVTEILAAYLSKYGKPIPNCLKKALGAAMNQFDAFSFAKYNHKSNALSFADVIMLVHPKPVTPEKAALFSDILGDKLPTPYTWETALSQHGNKREVWEELIEKDALGYMATLRNLGNIIEANPDNIYKVYRKLADAKEVENSKQMPFRFYAAYKSLQERIYDDEKLAPAFEALEKAVKISASKLPHLGGKTIFIVDHSGSMNCPISANSRVMVSDIANMLTSIATEMCDSFEVYMFNSDLYTDEFDKEAGILERAGSMPRAESWTDMQLPFVHLINNKIKATRLIVLSDNEINSGILNSVTCQKLVDIYRSVISPKTWVHAIDLQGYGTQQFCGDRVNIIAGWNDSILNFISLAEKGVSTLVDTIKNYEL